MPRQQSLPTWFALNGCNDITASGINDVRTGEPINAGGLGAGDFFEVTEKEANDLSWPQIGTLHSGQYRRVQIHENATDAEIDKGKLVFLVTLLVPEVNVLTTLNHGVPNIVRGVVLNDVTPGNWCFVQELGIASVYVSGTVAAGGGITVGTSGNAAPGTTNLIGHALQARTGAGLVLALLDLPLVQG